MLFNRRSFLKNIGLGLSSFGLVNILGTNNLDAAVANNGPRDPRYIRSFYAHLHRWHCQEFYDFDAQFHEVEKAYVQKCFELMDEWAYEVNQNFVYSLASYSHQVSKSGVNSSRVSFGSFKYSEQLKPYLEDVLRLRSISTDVIKNKKAIGLGWDFETGVFKVYFHHENLESLQDQELIALKAQIQDEVYSSALSSYSFESEKLSEKKLYLALTDKLPNRYQHHFSAKDSVSHTNLMVSSTRGVIPQMDLEHYDYKKLDQSGQVLFKQYKATFGNQLDTISYNSEDKYTLYFPH